MTKLIFASVFQRKFLWITEICHSHNLLQSNLDFRKLYLTKQVKFNEEQLYVSGISWFLSFTYHCYHLVNFAICCYRKNSVFNHAMPEGISERTSGPSSYRAFPKEEEASHEKTPLCH